MRIRLDPWDAEYEPALQIDSAEEPSADVDITVESASWEPITPAAADAPAHVHFVDGVRRIEQRILAEDDAGTFFGLLGSYAVGAVRAGSTACIAEQKLGRLIVVGGGGADVTPWSVPTLDGRAGLYFEPRVAAENTPEAPVQVLQNAMREAEAEIAASLDAAAGLVFLDGPLTFFTSSTTRVVGLVKRLMRSYLAAEQARILRILEIGQRTPIFLIRESLYQRYSWYLRLARGRSIDSSLTGVVRCETASGIDLREVRRVADAATALLPRFASGFGRDPRAPQNVYPIAGLESVLRHSLGDPLIIRRAIGAFVLGREVAAQAG